ncbi:MAG: ATP-binding protein [Archangium sp.]|nr:ATP-binding protein [Archangium sp.]
MVDVEVREVRRWNDVVARLSLVSFVGAASLGFAFWLMGAKADAVLGALCAAGALGVFALSAASLRPQVTRFFAISWYLALFVGGAVLSGVTSYLAWVSVLMLLAFFLGGPVKGLRWALVIAGVMVVGGVVMIAWPVQAMPVEPAVRFLRVLGFAPLLAAYGYVYEVARVKNATELEAARATSEQASHAKDRLLAKVSHEIRTPLNGVLGLTESLLAQRLPARAIEDLELIRRSGTGLLVLINDLLDIARAQAGSVELRPTAVELGRLLTDLAAIHRPSAELKRLQLRIDRDTAEPLWVQVDESRLRQIVGNLVSNAIKFTGEGEVVVRLRVDPAREALVGATISVQDTGLGLDPAALGQIFQPFTQFHTDVVRGGSGLGLSISRELASCLGGRLEVQSEPGRGSTFSLHLALERASRPSPTTVAVEAFAPFRALVVDDNQINRRVAHAFIGLLGGTTEEAADGFQAVFVASQRCFDVILMDLQMPGLDGLEATSRIRAAGVLTPIIALTAAAESETRAACLQAGMVGCLAKPVQLATLRGELARVLPAPEVAVLRNTG